MYPKKKNCWCSKVRILWWAFMKEKGNVSSQTILSRKLKLLIYYAKLGLASLDCYRNRIFQYFHPKICWRTNIVIDIRQIITIYRLCFDFVQYKPPKFGEGHFFWDTLCPCAVCTEYLKMGCHILYEDH